MAQGKTKVKAKVPKMIAKKQKQKGKGKAFTQRSSKFIILDVISFIQSLSVFLVFPVQFKPYMIPFSLMIQ